MKALQRSARLLVVLLAEVATALTLVLAGRAPGLRVPWSRLGPWLRDAPPADVLVALLRWAALAGALWVLATTLLYVAASASRLRGAVVAVRWSTLPIVRRTVDAAFAATLVGGAVLSSNAASATDTPRPTTVTVVRDGRSGHITALPPDAAPPAPVPVVVPPPPAVPPPAPAPGPAPVGDEVVVAPGDNLWDLAAAHLAAVTGRPRTEISDAEIAPYWATVCEENGPRLTSGDPDLVYPGERIELPPVS
jgi:hypothetical protein